MPAHPVPIIQFTVSSPPNPSIDLSVFNENHQSTIFEAFVFFNYALSAGQLTHPLPVEDGGMVVNVLDDDLQ